MIKQCMGVVLWDDENGTHHRRFEATLYWREQDPAVVLCEFHDPRGRAEWQLSRDVLYVAAVEGRDAGVEEGDVWIQVADDTTYGDVLLTHLTSQEAHQHVLFPQHTVGRFIRRTLKACPLGDEDYSGAVDDALRKILS